MTHITLHAPAAVAMPRGAVWAAGFFSALAEAAHTLWRHRASAPDATRRGAEAAALRRFASEVSGENPSFAADLYAAADRHLSE